MVTWGRAALCHTVPYHLSSSVTETQNAFRRGRPTAQISSVELLICQPTEICQRPTAQGGQPLWREQRSVTSGTATAARGSGKTHQGAVRNMKRTSTAQYEKKNKKKDTTLLLQLATIVLCAGKWAQRHKGKIILIKKKKKERFVAAWPSMSFKEGTRAILK